MKRLKKLLAVSVVGGFFCFQTLAAEEAKLVASNFSDRYHLPTCKIVAKIYPDEKITFNSPEEAQAAGYGPCKKCHPKAVTGNFGPSR
jgi:methylphosphotriester-DNA--protein-cysteine methyltransferase